MRKTLLALVTLAAALALQPLQAAGTAGSAPRAASLVVVGAATSKAKKKSTKKKSTKKKAACANGAKRDAKGNCPA